jgi:putative N-acetyltransferase (TIGR04045 family)
VTPAGPPPGAARRDCRIASTPEDVATHHRIRHEVFVEEQGLFTGSDLDEHDPDAIHVLGYWDGQPVGAVRLFLVDVETRLWQGDRLAVLPAYRVRNLGMPLVNFAVRTAAERGGDLMIAHVQLPNVAFFERIGWYRHGDVEVYVGLDHQPMAIDLTAVRARSLGYS